jgi:hypothetical protein
MPVKLRSTSTSDVPKKIVSPERALFLAPVFDSDRYEELNVQLVRVHLNGVCTIDLIGTMLYTARKLSEDDAVLESDNASLKSQINKLHEKVGHPQGSLPTRVGLQAEKEIADTSKAVPRRNPGRKYAVVAASGSASTVLMVSKLSPTERRKSLVPLR